MSMMLAAELAGLGTRSLAANIILNPDYGLLYYAALITTLPLESDQKLEKAACPSPAAPRCTRSMGTTPCLASCPKDGASTATIDDDGRIDYSYYDREKLPLALDELRDRLLPEGPGRHPERGGSRTAQDDDLLRLLHAEPAVGGLLPASRSPSASNACACARSGKNTKRLK